jgi:hypothetical protein
MPHQIGRQISCTTSIENYQRILARAHAEYTTMSHVLRRIIDEYFEMKGGNSTCKV